MPITTHIRILIILLTILWSSCRTTPDNPDLTSPIPGTATLSYLIEADTSQTPQVTVTMTLTSPPPEVFLKLPSQWAQHADFLDDIILGVAEDGKGRILPIRQQKGAMIISADGAEKLTFQYTLTPRYSQLEQNHRLYPTMDQNHLFFFGQTLFPELPKGTLRSDQPIKVKLKIPHLWQVSSTLQTDSSYFIAHNTKTLQNSAFLCGELNLYKRGALTIASTHMLPFDTTGLLSDLENIIDAQKTLFDQPAQNVWTILLRRYPDNPDHIQGLSRTGGFVLELGDQVTTGPELLFFCAHEILHHWNGEQLGPARDHELETFWFKEGVTTYLAVISLYQANLIGQTEFLAYLGEWISAYGGGVAKQRRTKLDLKMETYMLSGDGAYFYAHGALVALTLDLEFRRMSHGRRNLLKFIRDFYHQKILNSEEEYTNRSLEKALEDWSGLNLDLFFDQYVKDTLTLPLDQIMDELGCKMTRTRIRKPYYGIWFDYVPGEGYTVRDVDPFGPAYKAGLIPGDQIAGIPDLPAQNKGHATLEVITENTTHLITVHSVPGWTATYQVTPKLRGSRLYRLLETFR